MTFARLRNCALLLSLTAMLVFDAASVQAQEEVEPQPVQADLKGVIGLGLIGAEIGFVIPAALGAKPWWMYLVFPSIGAAGGAVAGYFLLEQDGGHPEVAVAMLVTGVALVIPTLVFTVARTSYNADEDMPTEPATALLRQAPPEELRAAQAGPGLIRVADGDLMVRTPGVTVARTMSVQEARRTGGESQRQYQLALVSGRF